LAEVENKEKAKKKEILLVKNFFFHFFSSFPFHGPLENKAGQGTFSKINQLFSSKYCAGVERERATRLNHMGLLQLEEQTKKKKETLIHLFYPRLVRKF